jgi:hypothetical protein
VASCTARDHEEGPRADEQRVWALAPKRCKRCVDLASAVHGQHVNVEADRPPSFVELPHCRLHEHGIVGIDQRSHSAGLREELAQEPEPLCHQLGREEIDPGRIPARPA